MTNKEFYKTPVKEKPDRSGICPGCLRLRHKVYYEKGKATPYCDKFCKELHRRAVQKHKDLPWRSRRDIFFSDHTAAYERLHGSGNGGVRLKVTGAETAQYEPRTEVFL